MSLMLARVVRPTIKKRISVNIFRQYFCQLIPLRQITNFLHQAIASKVKQIATPLAVNRDESLADNLVMTRCMNWSFAQQQNFQIALNKAKNKIAAPSNGMDVKAPCLHPQSHYPNSRSHLIIRSLYH